MNPSAFNRRQWLARCSALVGSGFAARTSAAEDHSRHHGALAGGVRRSEVRIDPANVQVTREDGASMPLGKALDDVRPVMLNFIFTSCTAICPVTCQVFSEVRDRLGAQRERLLTVSISIDPEYDTPRRLAAYAQRFGGGTPSWRMYTSAAADAVAIQQSFSAYQGDKMNHVPVTFLRSARGADWSRYDGFASPALLLQAVRPMVGAT